MGGEGYPLPGGRGLCLARAWPLPSPPVRGVGCSCGYVCSRVALSRLLLLSRLGGCLLFVQDFGGHFQNLHALKSHFTPNQFTDTLTPSLFGRSSFTRRTFLIWSNARGGARAAKRVARGRGLERKHRGRAIQIHADSRARRGARIPGSCHGARSGYIEAHV